MDHNDHVFINYRGIDRRYLGNGRYLLFRNGLLWIIKFRYHGIPDDSGRRIVTDFRYLYIAEIKKDHLELMHKEIIFPFYGRWQENWKWFIF